MPVLQGEPHSDSDADGNNREPIVKSRRLQDEPDSSDDDAPPLVDTSDDDGDDYDDGASSGVSVPVDTSSEDGGEYDVVNDDTDMFLEYMQYLLRTRALNSTHFCTAMFYAGRT